MEKMDIDKVKGWLKESKETGFPMLRADVVYIFFDELIEEVERLRHPSRQVSASNYVPCYEAGSGIETCDGYHIQKEEIKRHIGIIADLTAKLKDAEEGVEELKAVGLLWSWRAEFLRKLYTEAAKDGSLTWDKIDKVMAEDN